jgi:hypothetical protein
VKFIWGAKKLRKPEKKAFVEKNPFSRVSCAFHGTRVGAFDSSSKIAPRGLLKFIWGAKKFRKPEKIAFFEKIPFSEKNGLLSVLRVAKKYDF